MLCLGIESTAHTFGIGIAGGKGNILSNKKDVYRPKKGWGIIPAEAAKHHAAVKEELLNRALQDAGIGMDDIGIIAFSQGPGLPPCLHAGLAFAKELSGRTGKPLFGVNHCIAHIEIGRLTTGLSDPVTLYVSGANTQVISLASGRYRVFGETQDIGVGNALDKFGREAKLRFPFGPVIERKAKGGSWTGLPYVVKGMDVSFSGIVTEAVKRYRAGASIRDVCFSLQETMFSMLTEISERAMAHTGKDSLLVAGGVAANGRLCCMLDIMCRERSARFSPVPAGYAGDCGANIAWTGILESRSGRKPLDPEKADILPAQRTDDVDVGWL